MLIDIMLYMGFSIVLIASIRRDNVQLLKIANYALALFSAYMLWSLVDRFDESYGGFQMLVTLPWIPQWNVFLHCGVDAYALCCILLTSVVTALAALLLCEWKQKSLKEQLLFIYTVQLLLFMCFVTLDACLFLIFFEALLVPMYLWITSCGAEQRQEAGLVFISYTLFASVGMLLAIISLGVALQSFAWQLWVDAPLSWAMQCFYFAALPHPKDGKHPLLTTNNL